MSPRSDPTQELRRAAGSVAQLRRERVQVERVPLPSPDEPLRCIGERGQGLVPTVAGFGVVLIMLLVVTQVAFDLYARSAVTSAALDAARAVADDQAASRYRANPDDEAAVTAQAQERATTALGAYGRVTDFRWSFLPSPAQPDVVSLRVHFDLRGTRYSLVGPLALPGLNQFDRTFRVRVERIVCRPGETCIPVR